MRAIRIDDEVWGALQKKASAFEDTPNSVLRRVLGIDKKNGKHVKKARAARGTRTPQSAFREPLFRVLYESGGSGKMSEVVDRVGNVMSEQLNDVDRQKLATGDVRWRNAVQWERNEMVKEGLLKKDSPRGVWELTAKGIKAAEDASA
jgi:Mrr restriction endonuclease-like protein